MTHGTPLYKPNVVVDNPAKSNVVKIELLSESKVFAKGYRLTIRFTNLLIQELNYCKFGNFCETFILRIFDF